MGIVRYLEGMTLVGNVWIREAPPAPRAPAPPGARLRQVLEGGLMGFWAGNFKIALSPIGSTSASCTSSASARLRQILERGFEGFWAGNSKLHRA